MCRPIWASHRPQYTSSNCEMNLIRPCNASNQLSEDFCDFCRKKVKGWHVLDDEGSVFLSKHDFVRFPLLLLLYVKFWGLHFVWATKSVKQTVVRWTRYRATVCTLMPAITVCLISLSLVISLFALFFLLCLSLLSYPFFFRLSLSDIISP